MTQKKILVIEDEKNVRENVVEILQLKGYETHQAVNGREGIAEALFYKPDLILCDIMMPEMDGFEALEYIRQNKELGGTPFIFISAKSEKVDFRRGMELGSDDYLLKPFSAKDLINTIQTRLERAENIKNGLVERIDELKNELNHVSGHEYNTPLNGIIGFSSLLIERYESIHPDAARQMLDAILKSGKRLKRTLDNILMVNILRGIDQHSSHYKNLTTGKTDLNERGVDEMIEPVKTEHEGEYHLLVNIEPAEISLSENNLRTVITELVDNAIKFSHEPGNIHLEGRSNEDHYILRIKNTSQNVDYERMNRIKPYQQFDRDEYEQQGIGNGLYITKSLLDLNKGELNVFPDSEHQMTVVEVKIPLG